MPALIIHNLRKTYRLGKVMVPVLHGVDLEVDEGEVVAILGASGSGKTTLLHLIGGLDRPDRTSRNGKAARIEFQGKTITAFSTRELDRYRARQVGFIFQFYHLLPELTLLQNVMIAGMIGRTEPRLRERASELVAAVGLGHRLGHRPAELSGGERQRVAIARALINAPALVLADEPTGNLDERTGGEVLDLLHSLRRERRQTMVMVTHDHRTAERADRIVHLKDGRIVESGSPGGGPARSTPI